MGKCKHTASQLLTFHSSVLLAPSVDEHLQLLQGTECRG